jgi:hypothetical protein
MSGENIGGVGVDLEVPKCSGDDGWGLCNEESVGTPMLLDIALVDLEGFRERIGAGTTRPSADIVAGEEFEVERRGELFMPCKKGARSERTCMLVGRRKPRGVKLLLWAFK